jgi:hypothetical protein
MPHPGHFICAFDCRFHLNTKVGKYLVSTVGELLPDEGVREILAKQRGVTLTGQGDMRRADFLRKVGFDDIGHDRKYETIVFPVRAAHDDEEKCCPWRVKDFKELDCCAYKNAEEARIGHVEMCEKWDLK